MAGAVWMMVIAATGGAVGALVRVIAVERARRHLQPVDVRMTCPVRGQDVETTLMLDGRTGSFRAVMRCARFSPDLDKARAIEGEPTAANDLSHQCDQRCVDLLNIGIPLRPASGAPAPPDDEPDEDDR
jgi:hypothetical protein